MTKPRIAAIAVAAVIGVFYWWTWLHSWGMHLVDNPLVPWLQANAPPREHPTLYPAILAVHDAVMNVLLAIPFAAMLALSARLNDWSCAIVAALMANVMMYWTTEWQMIPVAAATTVFWIGLGITAFALPAAFLLVRTLPASWVQRSGREVLSTTANL